MKDTYKVSLFTIWIDKISSRLISFIGIFLISAVIGILIFIFWQVLPLLKKAEIEKDQSFNLNSNLLSSDYFIVDEWGETPNFISKEGIYYFDTEKKLVKLKKFPIKKEEKVKIIRYYDLTNTIAILTDKNRIVFVKIIFKKSLKDKKVYLSLEKRLSFQITEKEDFNDFNFVMNENYCFLLTYGFKGKKKLKYYYFDNTSGDSLFESLEYNFILQNSQSLTLKNNLTHTLIDSYAKNIVLVEDNKLASHYNYDCEKINFINNFYLFPDKDSIRGINFILGDKTFIAVSRKGNVRGFSLVKKERHTHQKFFLTKDKFENLPNEDNKVKHNRFNFIRSHRNKSFLLSFNQDLFLNYSTTQAQKLSHRFDSPIVLMSVNKKYNKIFVVLENGALLSYKLKDSHPEGSIASFFGKIWYEGESQAGYKWESSGSSNEFEPKLSMIPLIFGTLKATFYSMLFALPLAFFAALFTAEFLPHRIKAIIKPLIELMASLPSVVVGFLGALWLAPRIHDKIPLLILLCICVPIACILLVFILFKIFKSTQTREKIGTYSFILFIPLTLLIYEFCSMISPWFEMTFFTFVDANGYKTADFISWWTNGVGLSYANLNSLVVGISMGFAVIPIIYTIIEDSIFNVPNSIKSASVALGASKWQTIFRVTLPMASVGILSASMIGFGRAVGETMIVLFCAGGTALMEFNIFSGMRTLSVNLATELPEADYGGTLFRTLYLGALILFLMTFIINFIAEIFRQYMKKKYKNL